MSVKTAPFTTQSIQAPCESLYCHIPSSSILYLLAVNFKVDGVGAPLKLLVYLKTWSPVIEMCPSVFCLAIAQVHTFLNFLPSTVMSISNLPLVFSIGVELLTENFTMLPSTEGTIPSLAVGTSIVNSVFWKEP